MDSGSLEIQRIRVNRNVWKASLTKEIISLEDNLDQIYYSAGLKPHRIVQEDESDESTIVDNQKGISNGEITDFETIINEQLAGVVKAARNICALISSVTDFDLPIPVLILLRLASRVGSIRWSDFSKKLQGTMAKKYIYTKCSPGLITTSLTMFKWISTILGTNILPFQPFINSNTLAMLEWTRTSNLAKANEEQYHLIRSQIFQNIISSAEQLSLGINFDPKQVKAMLEVELLENLDSLFVADQVAAASKLAVKMTSVTRVGGGDDDTNKTNNDCTTESLKDKCACDALTCLDRLFIIYADFLDAQLELKLKTHVVQTCIKIYRDFERNVISLACRRQLLRLLETIASRPYASTTTELAWHVFELAERMETDSEIRYITRRAIKLGLAHRPIVVSHYDVHSLYANRLATFDDEPEKCLDHEQEQRQEDEPMQCGVDEQKQQQCDVQEPIRDDVQENPQCNGQEQHEEDGQKQHQNDESMQCQVAEQGQRQGDEPKLCEVVDKEQQQGEVQEQCRDHGQEKSQSQSNERGQSRSVEATQEEKKNEEVDAAVDERVQSYLDFFVDKPASQR